MKNPETVNEIYNHNANRYNDAIKNLEQYNNLLYIVIQTTLVI